MHVFTSSVRDLSRARVIDIRSLSVFCWNLQRLKPQNSRTCKQLLEEDSGFTAAGEPMQVYPRETDGQSFRHDLVHGFAWLSSILRAQFSEMTRTRRFKLTYSQPKERFLPPVQLTGYWEIFVCMLCPQKAPGKYRNLPVLAGNLLQFTRNRSRLDMRRRLLSFRLSAHPAFLQSYQTIWCIYFCLASLKYENAFQASLQYYHQHLVLILKYAFCFLFSCIFLTYLICF